MIGYFEGGADLCSTRGLGHEISCQDEAEEKRMLSDSIESESGKD